MEATTCPFKTSGRQGCRWLDEPSTTAEGRKKKNLFQIYFFCPPPAAKMPPWSDKTTTSVACKLIWLAARPAVTSCTTSLSRLVFQGSFQSCTPAFLTANRKLVHYWDAETGWKHSGLELIKTDVQDFRTAILGKLAALQPYGYVAFAVHCIQSSAFSSFQMKTAESNLLAETPSSSSSSRVF